ncbi:MAG: Verru_Chthon cassette protein A [Verrucomicrobiales bacterium]|jgi:uncharacterized protein (TIGR02600 family)|nr:Verru_Chthon cassette protein A [Verrucomicrobiales bacterium]
MKTNPISHPNTNHGVALISVLAVIVLVTALVIGFLVRAGYEGASSGNYRAGSTTRLLADTAVNLVQAEINEAIASCHDGGNTFKAWASQPGAIRVFDQGGSLEKFYRLYSAETQVVATTSAAGLLAADQPPPAWMDQPALWVDLNAPVKVTGAAGADDYLVFPILDPRDPDNASAEAPSANLVQNNTSGMPGFSISDNANPADLGKNPLQPLPMPVRWLYVLENGQIVAPEISGDDIRIPGADRSPIIGRIAFWTDDETAKVNINTACGSFSERLDPDDASANRKMILPAPWDVSRFLTWDDRIVFSESQPYHGEYQRYPGHPATTDIYQIFNALHVPMQDIPSYPPKLDHYAANQYLPSASGGAAPLFFKFLPRYNDNNASSRGGTVGNIFGDLVPISSKNSRLYTSVGELLYDYNDKTHKREASGLTRQQIESGKFFLSAHSRAPEETLFGTPRLSIWPINQAYANNPVAGNNTKLATPFDKTIAFCTTTGTGGNRRQYYFQRSQWSTPTYDAEIVRNTELYNYLQQLSRLNIPGFGGNFQSKYSADGDQILTEIFDYIRCTGLAVVSATDATAYNDSGVVSPAYLSSNNTQGLGRQYTISEIGMLFICTAEGSAVTHNLLVDSSTVASPAGYYAPVPIPSDSGTKWVSPVIGSANDPAYVSNLPVPQYLRNSNGYIVGVTGSVPGAVADYYGYDTLITNAVTGTGNVSTVPPDPAGPYPANPTLTTTGKYPSSTNDLQALNPGERRVQIMFLVEPYNPMAGFRQIPAASFYLQAADLETLIINDDIRPFFGRNKVSVHTMGTRDKTVNASSGLGGSSAFQYHLSTGQWGGAKARVNGWSKASSPDADRYDLISNPFTVSGNTLQITDCNIKLSTHSTASADAYQVFNVRFPSPAIGLPIPELIKTGIANAAAPQWWNFDHRLRLIGGGISTNDKNNVVSSSVFRPDAAVSINSPAWISDTSTTVSGSSLIGGDTIRTLIAKDGDIRLIMAKHTVEADGNLDMRPPNPAVYDSSLKITHSLSGPKNDNSKGPVGATFGELVAGVKYAHKKQPKIPPIVSTTADRRLWDWDNGYMQLADGAYANKADEGDSRRDGYTGGFTTSSMPYGNFESQETSTARRVSYFTANRVIPSAVMFGSLPTGVKARVPWQTLLFRPHALNHKGKDSPPDWLLLDWFNMPVVEPYAISEPFSTAGKINLNYQIVPFTYINRSTGIRAVLGTELIARIPKGAAASYTGLIGSGNLVRTAAGKNGDVTLARLPVDLDETLKQFDDKFSTGNIFKSSAEICDIYLVPKGYQWPGFANDWYDDDFALVGDNVRERPYADIYPRLTTKSNTYTVHYTVQSLRNNNSDPEIWDESRAAITGEYRGSTTIERYINPTQNIMDYATTTPSAWKPLDDYYQWRVIANNAFAP